MRLVGAPDWRITKTAALTVAALTIVLAGVYFPAYAAGLENRHTVIAAVG